jgi:hypothetical protein
MKFLGILLSFCFLIVLNAEAKKPKRYNAIIVVSDYSKYKGIIQKVTSEGITIDYLGKPRFIGSGTINSIKVKKAGTLTKNVIIGGAAGLGVGFLIYNSQHKASNVPVESFPVIVFGSAFIGAGVLSFINSFHYEQKYENLEEQGAYKKISKELSAYAAENLAQ